MTKNIYKNIIYFLTQLQMMKSMNLIYINSKTIITYQFKFVLLIVYELVTKIMTYKSEILEY